MSQDPLVAAAALVLFLQMGGMVMANLFSLMDRLAGIRWLKAFAPRPRVSWSLPGFFVIWVVIMLAQIALNFAFKGLPWFEGDGAGPQRALSVVSMANLLTFLVVPIVLGPGLREGRRRLGLEKDDFGRQVFIGVRGAWLASPWVYAVNVLASLTFKANPHAVMKMLSDGLSRETIILAGLSAVVFAPLAEELMFRGLLLGALIRKTKRFPANERKLPVQLANVATSLFFALLHADAWPAPIGIFVLSLALGKLYIATGRLWPSIVAHAVFNLTGVCGMVIAASAKKKGLISLDGLIDYTGLAELIMSVDFMNVPQWFCSIFS